MSSSANLSDVKNDVKETVKETVEQKELKSNGSTSGSDSDATEEWDGPDIVEVDPSDPGKPCLRVGDIVEFNCLHPTFQGEGKVTRIIPEEENPVRVEGSIFPLPKHTHVKKRVNDAWYAIECYNLIVGGDGNAGEAVEAAADGLRAEMNGLEEAAVDILAGRRNNP
ncbi:MAG: hypothetical protein SGILL_004107 [Bacillariaceae sp.]